MIRSFEELIKTVQSGRPQKISVAVAQDEDVLLAVENARKMNIAESILVGDKEKIEEIAKSVNIDLNNFEIIDIKDKKEACLEAIKLVKEGKASLPMKGFVDTSEILRAVLNKEHGIKTGNLISHVGVLHVSGFDRLFILSDSAMTIAPTLENKVDIINNSIKIAHALNNNNPKVAILCAVEKVNPKMPATIDAEKLTKMNEEGVIKGCIVKGPLAIDNAVSIEVARHKGLNHPVCGNADILITPDIEAGNILNKSMEYFAKAEKAGVIMGAKTPIILTSRASSDISKLHSIALGVLVTQQLERSN